MLPDLEVVQQIFTLDEVQDVGWLHIVIRGGMLEGIVRKIHHLETDQDVN